MVSRDPVVGRCPLELPEADTGFPRGDTVTPAPRTPARVTFPEQRAACDQRGMQVRSGGGCRRPEQPQPQHSHRVRLWGTFTGKSDRLQNQELNMGCIWKRTNSPGEMRHAVLCLVTYSASAWTQQEREMVNWKTVEEVAQNPVGKGHWMFIQKQRCRGQGGGSERTFEWRLTSRGETVSEEDRLKIGRADDTHSQAQGAREPPGRTANRKPQTPLCQKVQSAINKGHPVLIPRPQLRLTGARKDTSSYSN